jgi:hypothetical protein
VKCVIIASLLTLAMAGVTLAGPTVILTGSRDASNWYVWASASQGDNYGLACVTFKVSGVNPASQSLKAPQVSSYLWDEEAQEYVEEYKALFGQQRNNQLVPGTSNTCEYLAGMDTAVDIAAKRGAGQGPISFQYTKNTGATATYNLPASLVNNSIAPGALLIAQGALLPGLSPGFNRSLGYNANVFTGPTGTSVLDVGVDGTILLRGLEFLPEPTTLALLGLGGIVTLLRRRRG